MISSASASRRALRPRSRRCRAAARSSEARGVAGTVDDVEHHRVADPHARDERLGRRRSTSWSNVSSPHDTVPSGGFLRWILRLLLRVVAGLATSRAFSIVVLGRLDDHVADRVEAGPARAPGDLVELARLEQPLARAVVLRQRR